MSEENVRVDVRGGQTRCPYCHDSVDVASRDWIACADCLARHHAECWRETGRCGTCRGETPLEPPHASGVPAPAPARSTSPPPAVAVAPRPIPLPTVPPLELARPFPERSPERIAWEELERSDAPLLATRPALAAVVVLLALIALVGFGMLVVLRLS